MTDINEYEYLQMINQLHKKYKNLDKREVKFNKYVIKLKKDIILLYALIRIIDEKSELTNLEPTLKSLIEIMRGYASNILEEFILNITNYPSFDMEDESDDINLV